MTTHEERQLLMQKAQELHDLLQTIAPNVRRIVNMLIGASDDIALAAADEVSAGESVTKKTVTYSGKAEAPRLPLSSLGPEYAVGSAEKFLGEGKRACSLCREPGHRATNCPNAHKIQEAKKAEVAARPVKKTRAPMSAERKAQLVETLKKARAARKGKK